MNETWTNTCSTERTPLTLDELYDLAKSLPDPNSLVAKFEVGNDEMALWLSTVLNQKTGVPMGFLPSIPIELDPVLGPKTILVRNSKGKALRLFIRSNDKLLALDLMQQHDFPKYYPMPETK